MILQAMPVLQEQKTVFVDSRGVNSSIARTLAGWEGDVERVVEQGS